MEVRKNENFRMDFNYLDSVCVDLRIVDEIYTRRKRYPFSCYTVDYYYFGLFNNNYSLHGENVKKHNKYKE